MSAALALDPRVHARRDELAGDTDLAEVSELSFGRPHLRLVPTGPDVVGRLRPVRMTRRGRLIRSALVAAVTLTLVWTVVSAVTAGAMAPRAVTVTSGQTLSQIAAHEFPGIPVRDGVAAIQLANGLSSSDIHSGQVLTIPAAG